MINRASLHKVGMAKFAGLLVLAALAVAFFVTPMMALGAGSNSNAVVNLSSNVKIYFLGKVAGNPTANTSLSVGDSRVALSLTPTLPADQVIGGSWFMCAVKDPSTVNTFYIFTCTVSGLQGIKVAAGDVRSNRVAVILGLPANTAATSAGAMQYVGKRGALLYTLTGSSLLTTPVSIKQALGASNTGWS
jgi:hypothetical protein